MSTKNAPTDRSTWADGVTQLSQVILRGEKALAGFFMTVLLVLILVNVVTRFARVPIYWIDEASIFAMIWLGFIGASVMTRLRIDFAVTLLADQLSPKWVARLRALATAISLAFAVGFAVVCWLWLDPVGIASHGFDAQAYAAETFNFLYTERTQTLEWPTWVVNLILPIFALTLIVHNAANLLEDLGLARKREQVSLTSAEGAA
ncbi:TRAP transporter small permease [Shinella zoogloeoides]|uniref:TRAP transporter small permease protein n=1 Tax=Shinella zoogloeoides TaxID=352475 RepID=A0A6N8TP10_SHIZO|nr:TRAP transporter small permease [Shinella zoogloeoides]MXO02978.1 TRAP transporter small permease subunit [Shinella zoogloeoides]UEX83875.1 TRAP transporter small permease [Shinella zoogloeoides]